MSKTIDVEKGDAWTIYPKQQWVGHYRNGECIGCIGERYHLKSGLEQHLVDGEYNVLPEIAAVLLQAWGYTITTPAAKDEAPDADLAATVKRVEERVNDLTKIVHGLQDSMPGYDKDVTADEAFRRLDERLSKLEATTIRLDRPMEFGQGPATAICLAALRAVGVHDEEVNRE